MRTRLALAAGALCLLLKPEIAEGHFALGDPTPGGINYRASANFHNLASTFSDMYHVGAWSWDDPEFGEANAGWTHTSAWYVIHLDVPGTFVLTVQRQEGVPWAGGVNGVASTSNMFPSFTLYNGLDQDGSNSHTYTNNGNISWAEDITYLASVDNSTQAVATGSWNLAAGDYTLVVGSNAATSIPEEQGYLATFQVVPELSSGVMALAGMIGLLTRRPRRGVAECRNSAQRR